MFLCLRSGHRSRCNCSWTLLTLTSSLSLNLALLPSLPLLTYNRPMNINVLGLYNRFKALPMGKHLFSAAFCLQAPYFMNIYPTVNDLRPVRQISVISFSLSLSHPTRFLASPLILSIHFLVEL